MRWRELLFGAVLTFAVTIIGGLVLWYFTREPPRIAELKYTVDEVIYFQGTPKQFGFVTVKIGNFGTKAALDINILMNFPANSKIVEKQIEFSSSKIGEYNEKIIQPNKINIFVPLIAPNEIVTLSFFINSHSLIRPDISIRGKETVAIKGSINIPHKTSKSDLKIMILGIGLIAYLISIPFIWRISRRIWTVVPSVNNTSFLLIHKGLVDEARQILERSIKPKGAHVLSLANYGLALGLEGDIEKSERYLNAAEWWQRGRAELAVIKFDRAILRISVGDYTSARKYLYEAFSLSRSQISRYCKLSD